MKILITGAGLIGCHSAQAALANGHYVVLIDRVPEHTYVNQICGEHPNLKVLAIDILDWPTLLSLKDIQPDVLIHTAGIIGEQVNANPHQSIEVNVMGSVNMVQLCHQLNIKRLVHLSSFGVYDRNKVSTEQISEEAPLGRRRLYGACKVSTEQLITALSHHYKIQTVILRPAAVFGHGHFVGGSGVGIAMAQLMTQILQSNIVTLAQHEFPDNEYIYSKDVAQSVLKACTLKNLHSSIFNIGTGNISPVEDLAKAIMTAFPGKTTQITDQSKGLRKKPLQTSHAEQHLGFKHHFSLADALIDYAKTKSNLGC